jgi:FtsH-binding integral membrane protein
MSKLSKFSTSTMSFQKYSSRGFRERFGIKEKLSSPGLGYALLGIGIGGLGYLMYTNGQKRSALTKSMIGSGHQVSTDISLRRTQQTLMYFSGGLGLTTAMVAGMLRSNKILQMSNRMLPVLLTLPVSIFCMYQMYRTPNTPENQVQKHLYWLGFNACISFTLVPLIFASELVVIRDAFLLTSGSMAGLGLIAWNAKDDAFLGMQGILGAGLGGLVAVSIANIFLQSTALHNIWLYGGLALFLAFVLHDMKEIQNRAKYSPYFDPMAQSVGVYLDFVNIFMRLLMIMQGKKNK